LSLQRSDLLDATGSASGSILVIHDQTEVRELQDQLARQAHLAAIGNLSAAIAHEIRNPLAAISGSVELLRGDVPQESSAAMLVEIVLREVDRLNKLVTDFLNYARPQSLAARATDLRELVRGTLDSFLQDTTLVGETFEVEVVDALGDTGPVEVDADRLRQVLWNLLRNAAEANGGEGVVRVGLVHRANPASDDTVTIVVHDEGPGFSEEALGQIFEPFFTTKDGGTGLGLATCHRIVHAHDGALRAGNLPGRGAALSIVLPLREGVDRGGLSDVRAVEESDYATERVRSAEPSERRKRQR
jgi:two-component system sensor histidine kinase PilS (NtrC family)